MQLMLCAMVLRWRASAHARTSGKTEPVNSSLRSFFVVRCPHLRVTRVGMVGTCENQDSDANDEPKPIELSDLCFL